MIKKYAWGIVLLLCVGLFVYLNKHSDAGFEAHSKDTQNAVHAAAASDGKSASTAASSAAANADSVTISTADQHQGGIVVAPVEVRPVARTLTVAGQIGMDEKNASQVGVIADGPIVAVKVLQGDHVQKGQLLARIDDSVLVPQVKRLEASLEQAQAQAALSAAEYKRALGVQAAGALSAEDIEKRRATAVTDAANVKVAAAQLAEAQARLNRTRIVAPIAGTVLTRGAEVGQIANQGGQALFRVASGGEVEMRPI